MTGSDVEVAPRAADARPRRIVRSAGGAERDPTSHARKQKVLRLVLGIGVPLVLLLFWQVAAVQGWISRFDFPAPTDIGKEANKIFRKNPTGNMWLDVWASSKRLLWGYFWGTLVGLIMGVSMGVNRLMRAAFEPMLNALYTVPKLALITVFLIVFGFEDRPLIAIIAVTVFFFVWIQSMTAVMQVPENYREAARSFGSSRRQMYRHVLVPGALPQIFVGLRIASGIAVLTLIGAELVFTPGSGPLGQPQGIGYRINNARMILDPKQAYVGLVVAAVLGVVFVAIIKWIGRRLIPWAPEDSAIG